MHAGKLKNNKQKADPVAARCKTGQLEVVVQNQSTPALENNSCPPANPLLQLGRALLLITPYHHKYMGEGIPCSLQPCTSNHPIFTAIYFSPFDPFL
jgi:hypothetical protein